MRPNIKEMETLSKMQHDHMKTILGIHCLTTLRFALIKFGGGVVGMAGSIGGTTFARNRYGSYARARTKPVNPNTGAQQLVRAALSTLTARWGATLTAGQRTAWNLYGSSVAMKNRLGENVFLTGFNHYIRSNAFRAAYGKTPVDAGPVIFELPQADPAFTFAGGEAAQQITVSFDDTLAWDNEDGGFLVYYQGSPQNAQRNFFAGPWKLLSFTAGVTGVPVASPVVEASVFAIAEGQHQWGYARILRADGRISEPFRDDYFVGA